MNHGGSETQKDSRAETRNTFPWEEEALMESGPLQITGLKVNKSQVMVVTFKQTQTRVDNLGKWVYSDIAGRFVN